MEKINLLADTIRKNHPQLTVAEGPDYMWSSSSRTLFVSTDYADDAQLLHELAHALLDHSSYKSDVALLRMEREAWEYAKNILAPLYAQTIEDEDIENSLDTYRQWLHARSTCPHCRQNGLQTESDTYTCLGCNQDWKVNPAKKTRLKRTLVPQT